MLSIGAWPLLAARGSRDGVAVRVAEKRSERIFNGSSSYSALGGGLCEGCHDMYGVVNFFRSGRGGGGGDTCKRKWI